MAASIVANRLLETSKCLVILTLSYISLLFGAEQDIAQGIIALSLYENSVSGSISHVMPATHPQNLLVSSCNQC